MKSPFIHLHVHSHYSLLDGLAKVPEIIATAKEFGMPAVAITDHGTMYGAIEFYQLAKDAGIKPIVGVEVYVTKDHKEKQSSNGRGGEKYKHLVLLAENREGYQNLLKITTQAHLNGFYYKPRVDKDILRHYSKGLIALSACIAGEVPQAAKNGDMKKALELIKEYQEIFGKDNFYLELQPHPQYEDVNSALKELSSQSGAPLVATNDVHYVKKEDKEVQDILICVQLGKKVKEESRMSLKEFDLYFKSGEEMAASFLDTPEAIENTKLIADRCNVELDLEKLLLPDFPIPKGEKHEDYLLDLCKRGFKRRYSKDFKEADKEKRERLEYELKTINKMGFASYFLIVQDFVNWAKDKSIVVGPGRGSAAGSFVSYLLGVTELDPLKHDLLFERFLNPDRISMPDIDIDFADARRDEVIDYVAGKYGRGKVAQIITFGTMAARAAVRDAGRVLDYPYELCDKVAKMIPMFMNFDKALSTTGDLRDIYDSDPAVKKLIDYSRRLEGVARHASRHACGVVIGPDDLDKFTPLQYAGADDKTVITQYEMKAVEKIGLLKMDFLGLKNLTLIQNTVEIVKARHKKDIFLDSIPLDDKKAFALFQKGETTGFFQFESSGMRRYLKKLQPTSFEDIIAMAALYRPGPLNSGMVDEFIARKHGKREIIYRHPSMKSALSNTHGVIVYQEQVMQLSKDMAGFSGGEADTLRKGMGKKIAELIAKLKEDFIKGCIRKGIEKRIAVQTFTDMEKFAEYGFNRSHAACYALIGYQTAYLKAHYPAEFMAALLTADCNNTERVAIEVEECRQLEIPVLPPSINKSFSNFTVVDEEDKSLIRFGLGAVKNVGEHIVDVIVRERKENGEYKNLSDFLSRAQDKDLNKKSLESLIKAGAMDEMGERGQMLANLDKMLLYHKEKMKMKDSMQSGLFKVEEQEFNLDSAPPADENQRLSWEKELLGLYVSGHPLNEHKEKLEKLTTSLASMSLRDDGKSIRVGGVVSQIKKIYTKKGDPMLFAEIEDWQGRIEIVVFPRVFKKTEGLWEAGSKVIVDGRLNSKDDSLKVLADKIYELDDFMVKIEEGKISEEIDIKKPNGNENNGNGWYEKNREFPEKKKNTEELIEKEKVFLHIDSLNNMEVAIPRLNLILTNSLKGNTQVIICVKRNGDSAGTEMETDYCIRLTPAIAGKMEEVLGKGKVEWDK